MVAGFRQIEPQRIKLGNVRRQHVALAGIIGLDDILQLGKFHLLVFHVVGVEIVGEVELRGGFRLHADLAAIEVQRRVDVARPRQHESFAVIIGDRREIQVIGGLARHAPGRVARENVHLSVLQFLEAFAGIEGYEFCLLRIVEDGGGHRAAEIDIESGPVALVVRDREAGQALVDAAQHFAAPDRPFQGACVVAFVGDGDSRDQNCDRQPDQQAASKCAHDLSLAKMGKGRAFEGTAAVTIQASAAR
jgi:hypothetical protein